MLKKSLCLLAFALPFLSCNPALGQPAPAATETPTHIMVQKGVPMKTRDGVTLRADIYWPATEGKYPTLLQRTPYNKSNAADFASQAAVRGYLVVIQDVRGRYTSDGEWYPFKHETEDGYDAVEWAACSAAPM